MTLEELLRLGGHVPRLRRHRDAAGGDRVLQTCTPSCDLWRSGRIVWCIAIAVLFFTGAAGGIVTAAYLVIHHDESLPPRQSAFA